MGNPLGLAWRIWLLGLGVAVVGCGNGAPGPAANSGSSGSSGADCVPVDDHNLCTDDVCENGAPASKPVANGAACSDGNACTLTDSCQGGVCTGGNPVVCDEGVNCVAGACPTPCNGTVWLPGPPPTSVGASPSSIAAADLDGDGKPDLVAATGPGGVSVLRSLGNGTFAVAVAYPLSTLPNAVLALDLNGDGKPDLAVAQVTQTHLSVLLNVGDGTFGPAADYAVPVGCSINAIAAADVNGDGWSDLAVTCQGTNWVCVLRNLGNGAFAPAVKYISGAQTWTVAAADLNGDGKADLVTNAQNGNSVSVLLNLGNDTFAPAVNYSTGLGWFPSLVTAADLNGDGWPDLVVAGDFVDSAFNTENLTVLFNLGDGAFAPSEVGYIKEGWVGSIAAADLNADGKLDLAVTTVKGERVSVLLNLGNGTFAPEVSYLAGRAPGSVTATDVNGDGLPDLAVANGDTVRVLVNVGNGTFVAPGNYATGRSPASVTVADLNGDGKPDLVTANHDDQNASVLLNLGNGTFASAVNYATGGYIISVTVVDVNGDGEPDLAVADGVGVSVLFNVGNGTFAAAVDYAAGVDTESVAAMDLNGDGKPDLVTANHDSDSVSVLLNLGNGTFAAPVLYPVGFPWSVAGADMNGDGQLDLVVTAADVTVLLNLGNGTFAAAVSYAMADYILQVVAADLNGDGRPDFVATSQASDSLSVRLNLGNGTFAAPVKYSVGYLVWINSVAATDLNGDGWADLVATDEFSTEVSVLFNLGNGTFAAPVLYPAGVRPSSITAADLNGDGRPDLVTTNDEEGNGNQSGSVSVLLNTCSP
jgi:hypothetical protein